MKNLIFQDFIKCVPNLFIRLMSNKDQGKSRGVSLEGGRDSSLLQSSTFALSTILMQTLDTGPRPCGMDSILRVLFGLPLFIQPSGLLEGVHDGIPDNISALVQDSVSQLRVSLH